MARESLPGFIFDVQAWRGSNAIKRMSMAERGVYLEMLLEQWQKRSIPDDAQSVADAIATTPEQVAEVLAAWSSVRRKFVAAKKGPSRIYNVALERARRKQHAKFVSKSEAGRKAGKASAAKRLQEKENAINERSTSVNGRQQIREGKGRVVKGSEGKGSVVEDLQASPLKAAFRAYHERFLQRYGTKPEYAGEKDAARFKKLLDKHGLEEVSRRLGAYFDSPDPFVQRSGHTLDLFFAAGTQTKLIAELSNPGFQHNPGIFESAARRIAGNE